MRTYELMFVVDPRVADEDVVTMTNDYRQMIEAGGSQITKEESWGRRKLAYPINKLNEGKYVLFYISSENGKTSLPSVEHRMRQNDRILRYLTVRTDLDLKRAGSRLSPTSPSTPGAPTPGAGGEQGAAGEGREGRDDRDGRDRDGRDREGRDRGGREGREGRDRDRAEGPGREQ